LPQQQGDVTHPHHADGVTHLHMTKLRAASSDGFSDFGLVVLR
jgi:hypothetical protein